MPAVSRDGGRVRIELSADEAAVLRDLARQLRSVVRDSPRRDPVVDRLFPAAYEGDEDERSYRELVGDELRQWKVEAADDVLAALGKRGEAEVTLDDERLARWLAFLTDLRLALGTRLGVTEETMSSEPDPRDAQAGALLALHWLGWLQELLVEAASS